jgi:hypothetical protein
VKRLIAGGAVALVAVFAGVGAFQDDTVRDESGAIVEGGGVGAFVIQNGDCIIIPSNDLVQSVEGVPCSQSHDAEAYYLFDLADGSYPGPDWVSESGLNGCLGAFPAFVGISYDRSEFDVFWLEPTEDSWNELDDREIVCMVTALDGSSLTGSMRGSGR